MRLRFGLVALWLFFFSLFNRLSFAQDQRTADSLRELYVHGDSKDNIKLELIRNLTFNEINDLHLALSYATELIREAQNQGNLNYQAIGYFLKGNKEKILGDLDDALDDYLKSIEISRGYTGGKDLEANAYGAIADIYSFSNNHNSAMLYYHKGISILRESGDTIRLASAILNAGDEFLSHRDYDSALLYFSESGELFEKANYLTGKAYNLGNVGMVYASTGRNTLAEKNINEAIRILENSGDFYPICFYLISMADIYQGRGDLSTSLYYSKRSLELAERQKLKQQISEAHFKLSELYEQAHNPERSLDHYKNYIAYRDSVNNLETIQKMADLRTEFEVSLREKEIDLLQNEQKLNRVYIAIAVILLVSSVLVLLYFRQRFLTARLMADRQRKLNDEKVEKLLRDQETRAMQSLVVGREEERKRIAQDLHNHLGSLLATVKVNLNAVGEEEIPNYRTLTSLVDQACSDVRDMSHSLNMGISEDFGLIPALKDLVTHLQQSGGIEVEFSASMQDHQLNSESEILIYRIVQELVSNVLKHAQATRLSILLTCFEEENLINIIVQDNGKGFSYSENGINNSDGIGLMSIRQMVLQRNGELSFDSNPASGTTVIIDLPLNETSLG